MLQINNLSLQFGDKHLFKDITARLNDQDKIGLIGVNGTGKSTLLKMLTGQIETDFGVISKSKQSTIGYLPQEITSFPPGRTLYQEAETAFAHLLQIKSKLDTINNQLASTDPQSSLFSNLLINQGNLQQQLDNSDFFYMKSKIEKILLGLGFKQSEMQKDCNDFSGGWQMRLMLAKLLLTQPSFLFLDEPTNHLDIESLTWLENFLKSYNGSITIISHDRTFLDNLTRYTWELSLGKLTIYKGNYSKYVEEKEIRNEVLQASYNNQQAKIQQTMRFVTRFRAKSTKAKQVQSRLKQLSKLEMIELEESEKKIAFQFPPSASSGRLAIQTSSLKKSYDNKIVFNNISLEINRGDKVAIVGVNGAGKSTFVKILSGLTQTDEGTVKLGHNVKISYFGQHQAQDLSPQLTVLQTMEQIEVELTTSKVRSLLGAFLFRGDEVDKKVMVLSGGEKSRLALAKMIAKPANLLIMDEPTNHLDMMSQEVLQEALTQYDGSIVVVSHNRFFLDSFVNKVLEIKNRKATMFEGNITRYLEKANELNQQLTQLNEESTANSCTNKKSQSNKETRRINAKLRKDKTRSLGPLKNKIKQIERDIQLLEEKKNSLENVLVDPELYSDQGAFAEKSSDYKKCDERLNRLYKTWEEQQAEFEKLESEFNCS